MNKDDVLAEWDEKKQAGIDKKRAKKLVWRTRLSISYTVIRTILLIFLLYLLYSIPVQVIYDMSGKKAEFDRLVTTLVETHNPGLTVDHFPTATSEISPLLTKRTKKTLYRNVGEWDVVIGEVTAKKTLLGKINYSISLDRNYLNGNTLYNFTVAPDLLGEDVPSGEPDNREMLWDQFEKIGDGFVVQIHFSTKRGMDPDVLMNMLDSYDVRTYQMPVYSGELKEFEISNSRAGQFTFVPALILRPLQLYGDKNRMSSSLEWFTKGAPLENSIDQFYEDIEWVIENGNYHNKEIDKKRLAYLQENGIKVYGATVTGPIRELEKLQQEKLFHQFYLDGIEVWKWKN